ncbi:hypothetical protein [Dryocola sp. BD613]
MLSHLTASPLLVGNITVRELAQATFVSSATIMYAAVPEAEV